MSRYRRIERPKQTYFVYLRFIVLCAGATTRFDLPPPPRSRLRLRDFRAMLIDALPDNRVTMHAYKFVPFIGPVALALIVSVVIDCTGEQTHPADERLDISGGAIDLQITPRKWMVTHADLLAWVQSGAKGVSTYYGRFPVKHLTLTIDTKGDGNGIDGITYDGRLINMGIGPKTTVADLRDDWVLTHEMFHLAFPDMGEEHLWMNEGLSTYLEPVARARIGILSQEEYWKELVEGLRHGLPEPGDRGLDRTHTWGRTYWGGSLFWFLADLRIREQTQNHKSLDDAMRVVLDAGGDGSVEWSVDKVASLCDQTTQTQVVSKLYAEMATAPVTPDLKEIWHRLGVRYKEGSVTFDDAAPSAAVRRAMIAAVGKRE